MKITIPFILLFFALTSCNNDLELGSRYIDPRLKPYLNSFLEEAQSRGVNIDASTLTLKFGTYSRADAVTFFKTHTILIDSMSYDWKSGIREQLLFHEFGHFFLKRDHDDSRIGRYPRSIMAGPDDPNYENCKSCRERRSYYINELFFPQTKRPEWSYE
jgi:hypothetical protein